MTPEYRERGLNTYGNKCEICGYGLVEVHHLDYQEHQEVEDRLRKAVKKNEDITELLAEARKKGYLFWDGRQLEKDNRSTNLSVLCGNCHTLVHRIDCGLKLLKALPPRK